MRYVRYKDSACINLENVVSFDKYDAHNKYHILFTTQDQFRILWLLPSNEERDKVFSALLTQSSTINIVI